jgi:two-component system NtrC family sensor kinase
MRRFQLFGSISTRLFVIVQLVCAIVGAALLVQLRRQLPAERVIELLGLCVFASTIAILGWIMLAREHRTTSALAKTMAEERQLTASLETAIVHRTSELEDAERVLQRMWWLGQQITLELNPRRVLERFLEAVADIVQAEGGVVGLLDDTKIRIVAATGVSAPVVGLSLSVNGSAIGRVVRSGVAWTVSNIDDHLEELSERVTPHVKGHIKGIAIVPISRRGERIGAVVTVTQDERVFTTADLERIEAMGDLLSLALENAELVETLRQAEWRFRTLFRAAPDAVFTVLQSGRIREANDAVRDLTGADPLQAVGRPVVNLVSETDREKLRLALDATFAGNPTRIEVNFQSDADIQANSIRRVVALAMTRLPEADPPSVLLVGRDVTSEREMRVRLMESDRLAAVGELVAGVAHEVNNPLSSISAFAQILLRDGGLSPAQRESLDVIKSETLRASQVVKDLLAFARRSDPLREPLDLNLVIGRTLRLRGYQFATSRIHVEENLSQDLPPVIGDARQLQQVCLNLVTNAIQAMATMGSGQLVVTTKHEATNVVLEMRDSGTGIPEAAMAHIFEPFFTTKREGEGTGLGLSVSYGIISAHGGTIEVADTSASGTTFRVTIPVAPDDFHTVGHRDSGALVLSSAIADAARTSEFRN